MGCPDSIRIQCPQCGRDYWAQSKSGEECCFHYNTPAEAEKYGALADINRHAPFTCWYPRYDANGAWEHGGPTEGCGAVFAWDHQQYRTRFARPIDEKQRGRIHRFDTAVLNGEEVWEVER